MIQKLASDLVAAIDAAVKLAATDGACKKTAAYSIANTQAGYDSRTQVFAFSVQAEEADSVCHAHDFVVTLK